MSRQGKQAWRNMGAAATACVLLSACIPTMERGRTDPSYGQDGRSAPRLDAGRVEALPAPPPAWEMRAVRADARDVADQSYTVRSGDTLRGIAQHTGAGSEAIARANNLKPPYVIQVGQRLRIPGGRYHTVHAGETGIAIARAYGVDWAEVVALNDLEEPFILRTGQRVLIPSGGTLSPSARARAFALDIDDIVTGGQPALAENDRPARPSSSSARVLPADAAVAAPSALRGQFRWPVNGPVVKRFGPGASGERNDGIKIAVPLDTPVLAAADGIVAYVGSDIPALGGLVILKHGDGWTSVYGHAGQLLVQRGQSVKKGQMIALSGNSGFADRPELHFEIRNGRTPVDPLGKLPTL